jgi:ABC-type uncharacterized transport system substrate-binding protein
MRRRDFVKGISVWTALPLAAGAQPREQKRRVAVLMGGLLSDDLGGQAEAAALEVQSLPRPGGSVTGFSLFESSVGGKWLALLKEAAPAISRVSLLFNPETAPFADGYRGSAESAAPTLGITVVSAPCGKAAHIESAFAERAREGGGGIIGIPDTFINEYRDLIIELAARHRLPAVYGIRDFVPRGGLLAYSADFVAIFRRAASYVDQTLCGVRPGELPVQAPEKFTMSVNLKTAGAISLILPQNLIARADEVIE